MKIIQRWTILLIKVVVCYVYFGDVLVLFLDGFG